MRKVPKAVLKNRAYNFIYKSVTTVMVGTTLVGTVMLIMAMSKLLLADKSKYLEDQRLIEEAKVAKLQMAEAEARILRHQKPQTSNK